MSQYSPNFPVYSSSVPSFDWRSLGLAAVVHGLLVLFLWIGVQWQNKEITSVDAEVWDMSTREAAPIAEAPPEEVQQVTPVETARVQETVAEDPDIVLAQEKQRKLEEKKIHDAQLLVEREEKKRKKDQELALKKEKEKLAEQKARQDKIAAEDAAKKKNLDAKQLAKDKKVRDKIFEEDMKRLAGQATGTGQPSSTGDAARSTGAKGDPSYGALVAAKVRSNVPNLFENVSGNPSVEFRVDLLPDGTLRGPLRKLKSSGVPGFDEAVEKAIEKSTPLPRNKSGEVPSSFIYVHRVKD